MPGPRIVARRVLAFCGPARLPCCLAALLAIALVSRGAAESTELPREPGCAIGETAGQGPAAGILDSADPPDPLGGRDTIRMGATDSTWAAPPPGGQPPRRTNAAAVVLAAELANTAFASLAFVPHMSKPMAVVDAGIAFIAYMAPMDANPAPDENPALVGSILAVGFLGLAVANWGSRSPEIDLTNQQKFVANIAGPHVVIGLAAGADWLAKRLRHPPGAHGRR